MSPAPPPSRRLPAVALAVLGLLIAAYVALHLTTLDEAWGRPVSRGLQAAIVGAAAAVLALSFRPRRPRWWAAAVGWALVVFCPASLLLHRAQWVPLAIALAVPWTAALFAGGATRSRDSVTVAD